MPGNVRAKFYREDARDMIDISIVGDPNTLTRKVRPEDVQRFPLEWQSYQEGQDTTDYGGTPLTDVPGITSNLALSLKLKNVHNAEMLAELSDAAVTTLAMNGQTLRRAAQLLIKANAADKQERRGPGRPPKEQAA